MLTFEQALDSISHVLHQVPAVGDLDGSGRTLHNSIGISAGAVTADDFNARMCAQPCGERYSLAVRQQVNRAAAFEVNEDGAVAMPASEGPVVNAEYAWRRMFFGDGLTDAPQQGVGTRRHSKFSRHSCSCLAADGETDEFKRRGEAGSLTGVMSHDRGHPFAEDAPLAQIVEAAKTARVKFQSNGDSLPWEIGDCALIMTVNAC